MRLTHSRRIQMNLHFPTTRRGEFPEQRTPPVRNSLILLSGNYSSNDFHQTLVHDIHNNNQNN
jgi:hypothetical protein